MNQQNLYEALCMFIDGENDDSNHNGLARKTYTEYSMYAPGCTPYLSADEERTEVRKFVKWYMEEVVQ